MIIQYQNWHALRALSLYQSLAERNPSDRLARYNWGRGDDPAFSEVEVDALYAEIIDKIPAGVTKVLEIGSGGGHFAQALRAARPGIGYRGVDLVIENVESAIALLPAEDFVVGNAVEYLAETTPDWDYVVSIHCMFSCTTTRDAETLFDVLDANASKGFLIVGDAYQVARLEPKMTAAVSGSTGVTDSYVSGARDFLTEADLKGYFAPLFIDRASTATEQPAEIPLRLSTVKTGRYSETLNARAVSKELFEGRSAPTQVKNITFTNGLVASWNTQEDIPVELINRIKVAPKSVNGG